MMVKRAAPGGEGLVARSLFARRDCAATSRRSTKHSPRSRAGSCAASSTTRSSITTPAGRRSFPRSSSGCTATMSSRSRPDCSAVEADRRRHARAREERFPRNARAAPPGLPRTLGEMVARPRLHRSQPVARRARQPPRSLRQRRHRPKPSCSAPRRFRFPGSGALDDEVRHDQDLPESLVIRMASSAGHVDGTSTCLEREQHVAARTLEGRAVVREAGARPRDARRHQPHFLSRHRLLAAGRAVAGLAVLRLDRSYNPTNTVVGRLRGDEPLHRARAVGPAARQTRQRHPALLADRRHLGQSRGADAAARRARCEMADRDSRPDKSRGR